MKLLHDEAAMSLVDAKAVAFHLARRNGHCQRCGEAIEAKEYTHCFRCGSLTITW